MTTPQIDPREDPLFAPLTIPEAAEFTGRTQRTIRDWIAGGELEAVRIEGVRGRVVVKRRLLDLEVRKRKAALRGRPRKKAAEDPSDTPDAG